MQLQGKLKVKNDTQKVSEKFQKRDFVVTTDFDTPYPQHISLQLTQDKVNLLDSINVDDLVTVEFNLKGREFNGTNGTQYFNQLDTWKLTKN